LAAGTFGVGTFQGGGREFLGVVRPDGGVVDASGAYPSARAAFEDWDAAFERLAELASRAGEHSLGDLDVRPPVEPRQIVQSGANYRRHVLDLAAAEGARDGRSAEEVRAEALAVMDRRLAGDPYLFLGAVSALAGAYDDVVLPRAGSKHDWELELAVVIGRPGRHVPPEDALSLVAGYTIVNDLTTRDLVYRPDMGPLGTDWLRSKNVPTFLPTGPFIVPAAFVDWRGVRLTLRLNGDVMQNESTQDMLHGVPALVAYASSRLALQPGDLLATGSPAGNGAHYGRFLRAGDLMEGEITGLGVQRNRCVDE
jgi:2-keto-4-pentenoate hydratase/2-oxohepta-3-ene-1,7-dioic acid hydratase in catechol pathway